MARTGGSGVTRTSIPRSDLPQHGHRNDHLHIQGIELGELQERSLLREFPGRNQALQDHTADRASHGPQSQGRFRSLQLGLGQLSVLLGLEQTDLGEDLGCFRFVEFFEGDTALLVGQVGAGETTLPEVDPNLAAF